MAQVLPEDFLNEMSEELFDFATRGDSVSAANATLTGAIAFADEGRFMPCIESIQHALLLRKDPHLKAVREQLKLFHSGLLVGDRNAVLEARREIQKALRRLERRSGWDRALRWLTYVSVPVGIAESFVWSLPVAGTSLSVIGVAGTAAWRCIEKENEWVLFGA